MFLSVVLVNKPLTPTDIQKVETLLGRPPRGLADIAVRDKHGEPVVIRVDAMVADKPFPTLFWLVDKRLNFAIDQLEARGLIAQFQATIDDSNDLQAELAADHLAYIQLREQLMPESIAKALADKGFSDVLATRGIGGIANFTRIRCLHTYYGAHLVVPNVVGRLLDEHWEQQGHHFDHITR